MLSVKTCVPTAYCNLVLKKQHTPFVIRWLCRCDWVLGFVVRLFVWFGWLGGWVRLETESLPEQDKVKVAAPLRFEMKRI